MLKHASLKRKLVLGFSIGSLFLLVVGVISFYSLSDVSRTYSHVTGMNLPDVIAISEMRDSARNIRGILSRITIPGIPHDFVLASYREYDEAKAQYEKYSHRMNSGGAEGAEKLLLDAANDGWNKTLAITEGLIALSKNEVAGNREKYIQQLLYEYRPVAAEHIKNLNELTQYHENAADRRAQEAATIEARSKLMTLLAMVLGFLFSAIVGYQIATRLTRNLRAMSQRLAEGAREVAEASSTISATSNQLSTSSTEQASALQETVASIDQVNSMVSRNAENAQTSQEKSAKSEASAERGKEAVASMLHAMTDIDQSNGAILEQVEASNREMGAVVKVIAEISNKTKVINDIVFQTKLLSFNASVEAARAGDSGKGFAVVAEEVGKLAQMSGKAAQEIAEILDASMHKVESTAQEMQSKVTQLITQGKQKVQTGTETARRCADVLSHIVQEVGEVNTLVSEISQASKEQAMGVTEISKAMTQLDQVTQENTQASQHTASAATQLQSQADSLKDIANSVVELVEGKAREVTAEAPRVQQHRRAVAPKAAVPPPKAVPIKKPLEEGIPDEDDPRFRDVA